MATVFPIRNPEPDQPGLPSSIHTEAVILGAMLLDPMAINDATARLEADDFSLDSHRRIYSALMELMAAGHAVDLITLRSALEKKKELEAVGGPAYLSSLTDGIPRKLNIEDYVRIVKDKSLLRQMMGIFTDGVTRTADQGDEAIQILSDVEQRLAEVADKSIQRAFFDIPAIVEDSFGSIDQLYEQGREVTGLRTHYSEFDKMTSGLQASELIIIAARPSMGKTAWAINIAQNAAVRDGKVVAVFSLEMSKESLLRRMLAGEALVSARKLQTGFLGRDDKDKLNRGLERLMESKLFVDDTPGITLAEMRAKARRLRQQEGQLDLIVIDYLQLMTGSRPRQQGLREPHPGGQLRLPRAQGAGQGDAGAGRRALAALARLRAAHRRQEAPAVRPARIGLDRAGRRRRLLHPSRRVLRPRKRGHQGPGRNHHRQAAQRPHRLGQNALPQRVHRLHGRRRSPR